MKLLKLLHCDIYRDGGSLEGIWLTDENRKWPVTLKINYGQHPNEIKSYRLFNACIDDTRDRLPIIKNSPEHLMIRHLIKEWFADHNLSLTELEKETVHCNRIYDLLMELDKGNF